VLLHGCQYGRMSMFRCIKAILAVFSRNFFDLIGKGGFLMVHALFMTVRNNVSTRPCIIGRASGACE
jgi:hypothetical protein